MEKILDKHGRRNPDKLKFEEEEVKETLPSKKAWKDTRKAYLMAKYPWTVIDGKAIYPKAYINDIEPKLKAIHSLWCKGYSDAKICEIMEINENTFRKYLELVPEMQRLKEQAFMGLVSEIEMAQVKKAKGMKTKNVTKNYKYNEFGNKELVFESETETEHTPDTRAAKIFLQSHKPETYDRKNYREEQKELAQMSDDEFSKMIEQKKKTFIDNISYKVEDFYEEEQVEDVETEEHYKNVVEKQESISKNVVGEQESATNNEESETPDKDIPEENDSD